MTAQTTPQTNTHSTRGRKRAFSAAVASEASDDNSEAEELSWEWLYSTEPDNGEKGDGDRKRRRVSASSKIVGARYGDFECRVGDTVMLKAGDVSNGTWAAIICDFREDGETGEMSANFMWFLTEKEIRNTERKRKDFHWVCIVATPLYLGTDVYSSNHQSRTSCISRHLLT